MRTPVIWASAVTLAGAGLIAPTSIEPATPTAAAQTAPAPAPGIPVTVGTVATADVPVLLHGIGTVQAFNMVTIKSRVDGQIIQVAFTEGEEIKAGAPLLQIDPRPYQAALEQAQAGKAKDEAQLVSAQADLERYTQLVGSGYQTRQSYDQQKALVAQLQASIKGDEAQINAARINLGYTQIYSPIDGRLGARLVDIGNLVHATDNTGLVTITQLKPIFVSFTLPQDTVDKIREEQAKAPLVVRAYRGDDKEQLAEGKLTLVDNIIDQATGTIHLKAAFPNTDERLWPGEFVNVRLILSVRHGAPTIPAETMQDSPTGRFVYVIKSDSTVERRAVEIAAEQDGMAVIAKGLSPGEKVVVNGQYRLTDGARVEPAAAPASAPAG
ncbi:MAG: efflux RND transporter periplasmic adaptor subunit [Alphaproteobacteria bacterium]|nr:efflux RND transporter periplasmic adaptor subunit [Alphaproteobacteria bacterium]